MSLKIIYLYPLCFHDKIIIVYFAGLGGVVVSQSKEDYLKFIYEHSQDSLLSNKEIAAGLGIAPPSVSEMMAKLTAEGLVEYKPYHGGKLTQVGAERARDILRKHEIWEYFLQHKLGYSASQVHDLAEVLEHVTPADLADRLAQFIDFPEGE